MAHQSDVTWPITVSLTEALRGCSRIVYFPRREVPCRQCLGSGTRDGHDCEHCEGTGWSEIIKRIPVDLPPLPGDLARIRVAGAGEHSEETGGFGDLRLVCHVVPQDGLDLADGQLHVTLAVSPQRQQQGGRFELALPEQTMTVDLEGPLSDGDLYEFDLSDSPSGQQRTLVVEVSAAEPPEHTPQQRIDSDEINRLHAEARNAEKARDFELARDVWCELAEVSPSARALRKCGWMHLRLDDLDTAARRMREAVDEDWSNAEAHYYKGAVHHKREEPLLAAVEVEYARKLGLHVEQSERIRRRNLQIVFQPSAELSAADREQFAGTVDVVTGRYYGAAAATCRELLRSCQAADIYYQHGAANWLLSIDSEEDRLAEAYLGLRVAASISPDSDQFARALAALEAALDKTATPASRIRIAGHLLRQGAAEAALEHTHLARDAVLDGSLHTDREAAALDEAAEAAVASCSRLTDALQPVHRHWEEGLTSAMRLHGELDEMIGELTPDEKPPHRRETVAALKEAAGLGRDVLLPLSAELQQHLEQHRRALPNQCHAWLEGLIGHASALKQQLRQSARMATSKSSRGNPSISEQIRALEQLRDTVGSFRDDLQQQYTQLDRSLCNAWRARSQMLHVQVMVSQHVGRDDHLERCRRLTRAVRLAQLARSMRPEVERTVEQRRATCRLLDDFQETAQAAAGTGAFARAEFFQNTIDSLRGDLVPNNPLAADPEDMLQEDRVDLFDWACDVLFDGTTAFPQEFLIDAREGSYAVTNYRLAHRQSDATTYTLVPLTSIQRYHVRASGATTRVVTLTLKDGRRITFNDVPTEQVLPDDLISWLLAAEMWNTLTEAELEALDANRPAPTSQLPAEAARDRRRLLGDTRQEALGDGSQTVVCPHCGRHNFPRDRFCRDCGAELEQQEPQALTDEDVSALPDANQTDEDGDDSALP